MPDTFISQVAADNRKAARIYLAVCVENTVSDLGILDTFTDNNGNGPIVRAITGE